ncbi:MAG: hypothetical protein EG824_13945 [Deltaproteobacteria bacterium]|nr:hypothetical protein [Deltaproteobacteria bacterium]
MQTNSHEKYHVLIIWQTGRGAASVPVNLDTARHWQYIVQECTSRFLNARLASSGLPTELITTNIEQIAIWTAEEAARSGITPTWKNPDGAEEIENKPERVVKDNGKIIAFPDFQI